MASLFLERDFGPPPPESDLEPTHHEQPLECDEGQHTPSPLWNWRCEHCSCLLCTSCGKEKLNDCTCPPPEVRHG